MVVIVTWFLSTGGLPHQCAHWLAMTAKSYKQQFISSPSFLKKHLLPICGSRCFASCGFVFFFRGGGSSSFSAAAGTGGLFGVGLLRTAGIGLGGLGGGLVGQPADPDQTVLLLGQPDADQEFPILRTGSQVHVSAPRLGKPPGAQHFSSADGANILAACHGAEGSPLVRVVVENLPVNAPGKLRAMEAVFVTLERLVVFPGSPIQIQLRADQRGVVGIPQGIMGRTAGLDAKGFHGGFSAFWELEPSVWALKIIWALYHRSVHASSRA